MVWELYQIEERIKTDSFIILFCITLGLQIQETIKQTLYHIALHYIETSIFKEKNTVIFFNHGLYKIQERTTQTHNVT